MNAPLADYAALCVALEAHPEVLFAYLFGSAGTGVIHRMSDLDVAVYVSAGSCQAAEPDTDLNDLWMRIHAALVHRLHRDDVDLILLNRTPPLLAERVARYGQVLFSRDEVCRIRWIVETKNRYCDLQPVRSRLDRVVAERAKSGRFGYAHG